MKKILFICKRNECYGFTTYTRRSSGLFNSTNFIVEYLRDRGVEANIIEVHDNNDIDRELTKYKPDICVIEALWVVPEKFPILKKLHPKVEFCIHMHSGLPFLAIEGSAIGWLKSYINDHGLRIIANSIETHDAFKVLVDHDHGQHKKNQIIYLPNIYVGKPRDPITHRPHGPIRVGCFGAVRPMKNHLSQALAALQFARECKRELIFSINGTRVEVGGEPVMKNLRNLFEGQKDATLVVWKWHEHAEFIENLRRYIDIGMQVSMSETFNVVSADYVTAGLPIVVSNEVKWASSFNKAQDDSTDQIALTMHKVYDSKMLVKWNQRLLKSWVTTSQNLWFDFLKGNL